MPSFSQLAAFTTVAFAALSAAAPVTPKRQLTSLPDILTGLLADITPVTDLLSSITTSNATEAVISPLLTQLSGIVTPAVAEISALAGSPVSTILATADGVISTTEAANLLAPVLTTAYGALNDVIAVANSAGVLEVVQPLVNEAGAVLSPILTTAAPLLNGLLAAVAPLLSPILGTLNDLGLGPLINFVVSIV